MSISTSDANPNDVTHARWHEEPTPGLLMSMALRLHHGLGLESPEFQEPYLKNARAFYLAMSLHAVTDSEGQRWIEREPSAETLDDMARVVAKFDQNSKALPQWAIDLGLSAEQMPTKEVHPKRRWTDLSENQRLLCRNDAERLWEEVAGKGFYCGYREKFYQGLRQSS